MGSDGDTPHSDDWSVQLDDDFIAGGVREEGLHRYAQPPPHPRAQSKAARTVAGPRDWSPSDDSPADARGRVSRRGWVTLIIVAVVLAGGSLLLSRHTNGTSTLPGAPRLSPAHSPLPPPSDSAGASSTEPKVYGITPTTRPGTCFTAATQSHSIELAVSPCARRHAYELVEVELATGDDQQYPDDRYWGGPVRQRCSSDLLDYTAQPRARWPRWLASDEFVPTRSGWTSGERTVFCVAHLTPMQATSVRQLRPQPAKPTAA